nr:SDR family oxidoreductase [Sphingorhabdus sp.]
MTGVANRVCVVTGAARGLGQTIARTLAANGARVAICDIRGDSLAETAEMLRVSGGDVYAAPCDVSDSAAVDNFFAAVESEFGPIEVLVNNAAIVPGGPEDEVRRDKHYTWLTTPVERDSLGFTAMMSDAEWHKYWAVNVHGLFYCTRAALRHMEPRRYGRIVNIASIAGMSMFSAHSPHYSATKGAVIA